jgi:hypothetical protein
MELGVVNGPPFPHHVGIDNGDDSLEWLTEGVRGPRSPLPARERCRGVRNACAFK